MIQPLKQILHKPSLVFFARIPVFLLLFSLCVPASYAASSVSAPVPDDHLSRASLTVPFVKNEGQGGLSPKISYYAQVFGGQVLVSSEGLSYVSSNSFIKERFLSPIPFAPFGDEVSPTHVSYFVGSKENWRSDIPSFNTLLAKEVWPAIDVSLRAYQNNLEKIFVLHPGSDPDYIQLSVEGAGLAIDEGGRLVFRTPVGEMTMTKPYAYQEIGGKRVEIPAAYAISGMNSSYGFHLGTYDKKQPLFIDPLIASTFFAGSGFAAATDIARDSSGNIYVSGAAGTSFPVTAGAYDESYNGGAQDIFVMKLDPTLSTLLAATYIGSPSTDSANGLVVDSSGNVYISGSVSTSTFPATVGAYDETFNGSSDAFVSKFNSSLTTLLASTYLGGTGSDQGFELALDSSGNLYVTGRTTAGFPTTSGAYDETYNGSSDFDSFIAKFDPTLSTLSASTYLGGSGTDQGINLTIDSAGNVYGIGQAGTGFPTTSGAYDETQNGSDDAYVVKLNSTLTTLSAATFLGGSGSDTGRGIALDSSGNLYLTGTGASGFPTSTGAYDTTQNGSEDIFITEMNSTLTTLIASTFVGGSGLDRGTRLVLDTAGNVYVSGNVSSGFPTSTGAYDTTQNGSTDAAISKVSSDLTTLIAATFIGGSGVDQGNDLLIDSSGNVYLVGQAGVSGGTFPSTPGAYDTTQQAAITDGYVAKFTPNLLHDPNVAFSASTGTAGEGSGTVNIHVILDYFVDTDTTVNYAVTGGTATGSGTDYTLASGTSTIVSSTVSTVIPLVLINDLVAESPETIQITLSSPSGATLGSTTVFTFTVTENPTAASGPGAPSDSSVIPPLNGTTTTPAPTSTVTTTTTSTSGPTTTPNGPSAPIPPFVKDIRPRTHGSDVKNLQVFLNTHGFSLATEGAGSPGAETDFYGAKLTAAVIKFQKANHIVPVSGMVGPITRAWIQLISLREQLEVLLAKLHAAQGQ